MFSNYHIQGDSGKKVNILGGDNFGRCEKELHTNMCLILNGCPDRALWISRLNSVRLSFVELVKSEVYKLKVETPDELLARILGAAVCIKEREDQLRRKTRDLRTRVTKFTEVDVGIFEHLLWTVTDLSFRN
jgi:hypothetical protein